MWLLWRTFWWRSLIIYGWWSSSSWPCIGKFFYRATRTLVRRILSCITRIRWWVLISTFTLMLLSSSLWFVLMNSIILFLFQNLMFYHLTLFLNFYWICSFTSKLNLASSFWPTHIQLQFPFLTLLPDWFFIVDLWGMWFLLCLESKNFFSVFVNGSCMRLWWSTMGLISANHFLLTNIFKYLYGIINIINNG